MEYGWKGKEVTRIAEPFVPPCGDKQNLHTPPVDSQSGNGPDFRGLMVEAVHAVGVATAVPFEIPADENLESVKSSSQNSLG